MLEIKYEIKLNEVGRPCIDFPKGYENNTEDKFFAMEIARYLLQTTYNRMTVPPYDANTVKKIGDTITVLAQIGDEIAELVWNQMKSMGDVAVMMGGHQHIKVNSIEERDAIPLVGFFYDEKIFNRQEGLRVCVREKLVELYKDTIYELQGGIGNDNWVEL